MTSAINRRLAMNAMPFNSQTRPMLAKVIAVHSDIGAVDVAIDGLGQAGYFNNVPVMSWSYGSQTGQAYMPSNIDHAAPVPSSQGTYDPPIASGKQDVWCVVEFLSGRSQRPVCIGFVSMLGSMIQTKDPGWEVKLHESGVWSATDPEGNVTIGLPDGSSVVIGTSTTPADMTTVNDKWNPKTMTTAYNITLDLKGNLSLTIKGDTSINVTGKTSITSVGDVNVASSGNAVIDATNVYLAGTGGQEVARKGDAVQVDTTTGVGTITSGSAKVFSG